MHHSLEIGQDVYSSPSGTTIATPSPLSPVASLSLSPAVSTDTNRQRKKPFSLPRIVTHHKASNNPIQSISARTSAQLDSPLSSFSHGLPPLSLPSHTLSFSPQSVASFFSSAEQSRCASDANMSPPLPPSPPSSTTPASFVIPSPLHQDYASLPEIPSSPGFATSFYPVLEHPQAIHDVLSPMPSNLSRGYDDDSPVLPSDEEMNPNFLSPLLSPQQRDGLSPSSAEMDAFGFAASHISGDSRSDISIPTSLQSQFVTEQGLGAREVPVADADATLRPVIYEDESRSASMSSIGTLSLEQHISSSRDLELRRHKRRSEPPLSLPAQSPTVPHETTVTSSAVCVHTTPQNKPSGMDKVKKFGGKLKKLFGFRGKIGENDATEIGVSRSTQVTNVEYASVR